MASSRPTAGATASATRSPGRPSSRRPTPRSDRPACPRPRRARGGPRRRAVARPARPPCRGRRDRDAVLRYAPEAADRRRPWGPIARPRPSTPGRSATPAGSRRPSGPSCWSSSRASRPLMARYDVANAGAEEARRDLAGARRPGPRGRRCSSPMARASSSVGRNAEAEAASRRALELVERLPDGPEKPEALNVAGLSADARPRQRRGDRAGADARSSWAGDDPGGHAIRRHGLEHGRQRPDPARRRRRRPSRSRDEPPPGQRARVRSPRRRAYAILTSAFGEMYRFADAEPYFEAGIAT